MSIEATYMQAPNPASNRGFSLIQDCGYYSSSCGYCRDGESSISKSSHGEFLVCYLAVPTVAHGALLIICMCFRHARTPADRV